MRTPLKSIALDSSVPLTGTGVQTGCFPRSGTAPLSPSALCCCLAFALPSNLTFGFLPVHSTVGVGGLGLPRVVSPRWAGAVDVGLSVPEVLSAGPDIWVRHTVVVVDRHWSSSLAASAIGLALALHHARVSSFRRSQVPGLQSGCSMRNSARPAADTGLGRTSKSLSLL